MKRIISFILAFCISISLTTAFAENENDLVSYENIIDTSLLTDENVLYKAMQDRNGFSLFGLNGSNNEEITGNFDVVLGFDMSYSMYEYDINGDKQWMDNFKTISEQAPEDTRYAVLSSNSNGFTDDLDAAISDVQGKEYTGTKDVMSILDKAMDVYDDESSSRNKVVLVTTHKVDDVSVLKDKMDELNDYGIIPFVFVLNTETNDALNMDGIYQCTTDLDLRLAISDLYLAFSEFNMTTTAQTYANSMDYNVYRLFSDFRPERHMFNGADNSAGLQMASMLNMYKCVPLKAEVKGVDNLTREYDLLDETSYTNYMGDLTAKLEHFVNAENKETGNMPSNFCTSWESILENLERTNTVKKNPSFVTVVQLLRKNIRRRFPIMIKCGGKWEVIYQYDDRISSTTLQYNNDKNLDIDGVEAVFDTYQYLMSTISNATNLYDTLDWQSSQVTIDTVYPEAYTIKINGEYDQATIKRAPLIEEAANEGTDEINNPSISYVANGQTLHTTVKSDRNFVIASLTTFKDGYPNIYGSNKVYRIKLFTDIKRKEWYTDYVFTAMNKEIISGYTDRTFRPNREVSRGELIIMMLKALDIVPEEKYNRLSDVISQEKKSLLEIKLSTLSTNDINKLKLTGNGININNIDTLMGTGSDAYWGKQYMNYALANDIITVDEYLGFDYKDKDIISYDGIESFMGANIKLTREEAARMIWETLYIRREQSNVPTLLYEYPQQSNNYKYVTFSNYGIDMNTDKGNAIYQLYMNGIMNGHNENNMGEKELLTRAQVSVLLIKSLFDLDENIPVIEADIDEIKSDPVPVAIKVNTRERIIKDIVFNANNEVAYELTFDWVDNETSHKYVIQTIGELTTTKVSATLDGTGNIDLREGSANENDKQNKNVVYSCNAEKGKKYTLTIKRDGTDNIGLKIVDMNIPQPLEFVPQSGGRYIYSNCQENIGEYDIVDSSVPSLIFSQEGLTTGKYTIMLEHMNELPSSDIYVDVLFYDKNSNSQINITKYGNATFNYYNNINHAGIPAYSSFMGLDVARVRTVVPDTVNNSDERIIRKQSMWDAIANPSHEFKDGSACWLSDFVNQKDEYPKLAVKDYIYTMLEFEVISEEGITCSIAAYKNKDVHDNFENYITYDEMLSKSPYPEWGLHNYKGIAEFMPETIAELDFIIDDDSVGKVPQITTSNPFGKNGYITTNRWKTHQNPQADRYNPDHNVTSDIIPLIYNDPFNGKLYFDTMHNKNGIDLLDTPKIIEENDGDDRYSSNLEYACNLANFSVCETYKIKVQNITDAQRTLCYQLETPESNVFISVRDSQGNYIPFTLADIGEQVEAICTGEVGESDREKFHPITTGKIRVELPETNDDLTQIKLDVKEHCTEEFYIDITLPGANNGGIHNKILFE